MCAATKLNNTEVYKVKNSKPGQLLLHPAVLSSGSSSHARPAHMWHLKWKEEIGDILFRLMYEDVHFNM